MKIKKLKKRASSKTHHAPKIKEDRKHILSSKSSFFLQEAYKSLRTNINFSLADQEGCKVILVTSAMQSEGKSVTALNLAISLAQTDQKVLIIDCDLRRPKLGRLLNISADMGMSNLLMDDSMMDVTILHHDANGIDLILSGDIPPNPSELLSSGRMQKVMEILRARYDYIILDSPPVDMVIDAVVLAPQCDGVLFVVRANSSERGAVMYAIEQLEYAKAKVLGFVFNGMTGETASGYGKYRYKRYGRYGYYRRYGRYNYSHAYYQGYSQGYNQGYNYGYGYGSGHNPGNPSEVPPHQM